MNYIRTNDGVYEVKSYQNEMYQVKVEDMDLQTMNFIKPIECVIKEADNLEELCDEFIHEYYDDVQNRLVHTRHSKSDVANAYQTDMTKGVIYGAIWNDKGLQYIAKMNDKGELELI